MTLQRDERTRWADWPRRTLDGLHVRLFLAYISYKRRSGDEALGYRDWVDTSSVAEAVRMEWVGDALGRLMD